MTQPTAKYERYKGAKLPLHVRTFLKKVRNKPKRKTSKDLSDYGNPAVLQFIDIEAWAEGSSWAELADVEGGSVVITLAGLVSRVGEVYRVTSRLHGLEKNREYHWLCYEDIIEGGVLWAHEWNRYYPDCPMVTIWFTEMYISTTNRYQGDVGASRKLGFVVGADDFGVRIASEFSGRDPRITIPQGVKTDHALHPYCHLRGGLTIPWPKITGVDLFGLDRWKARKKRRRR